MLYLEVTYEAHWSKQSSKHHFTGSYKGKKQHKIDILIATAALRLCNYNMTYLNDQLSIQVG